jgi:hypothetical protein
MIARDSQIYKDTFILANYIFDVTAKMNNIFKPTIARRMENSVLELAKIIIRANSNLAERVEILGGVFTEEYENLQFLINLAFERKQVSYRQQAHLARLMTGIGKQATAWKRSAENKRKMIKGPLESTDKGIDSSY